MKTWFESNLLSNALLFNSFKNFNLGSQHFSWKIPLNWNWIGNHIAWFHLQIADVVSTFDSIMCEVKHSRWRHNYICNNITKIEIDGLLLPNHCLENLLLDRGIKRHSGTFSVDNSYWFWDFWSSIHLKSKMVSN